MALCQLGVGGANLLQCEGVGASKLNLDGVIRHQLCHLLEEVAELVADDAIKVELARTYSFTLEQIRAAYTELAKGHVRGKLVIDLS